jgi:isopentenyldiphosphate isomerase
MIIGNGEIFAYSEETENPASTAYLLAFSSHLLIQRRAGGKIAAPHGRW